MNDVRDIIKEAREAGTAAAEQKLAELQRNGPQWAVMNGTHCVGCMLDVCGTAWLQIPARGKFYLACKQLTKDPTARVHCVRAYRGGGSLAIFDSTSRQEISVNRAAAQAQADVLAKYNIQATVQTRID